jgi:hypothetical protein
MHWLATACLPQTIRSVVGPMLAGLSPSSPGLTLVAVIVAAVGLLARAGSGRTPAAALRFAERMGWLAICWTMTYLPFVVLRENGGEAIYATGLQTATLLVLFLAARELCGSAARRLGLSANAVLRGEWAFAAMLCFCLATAAGRTILREVVFPAHNRYRAVARAIAEGDLATTRQIYVVPDAAFLGAYAEGLVRGVLNEAGGTRPPPRVVVAFAAAPPVVHLARDRAVERYGEEFTGYYSHDAVNDVFVLKPDLAPGQRAAADTCFARFLEAARAAPDTIVIDLSRAVVGY